MIMLSQVVPTSTRRSAVRKSGHVVPMFTTQPDIKVWSCSPNVYAAVGRQKAVHVVPMFTLQPDVRKSGNVVSMFTLQPDVRKSAHIVPIFTR